MFEELQRLYEAFLLYKEGGGGYRVRQSKLQMEQWAEDKVARMENESIAKDYAGLAKEIGKVQGPKFYKKHLLNSVNESLGRKDLEAIANMHKYFDYNLNFIDLHGPKPVHPVKVHQPELNLANLQLRLGQTD
jgi:hypothetical protein